MRVMDALSDIAPGLIAVAAALFVWRQHRADRRARVFLALALSELAWGIPFLLDATAITRTPVGVAAVDGFVLATGLVSTTLFLHFGLSFPHARPWLLRGNLTALYLAAFIVGALPVLAAALGQDAQRAAQHVLDGMLIVVGPLVAVATVAACVSVYRSYREMPADERRAYRVPVMGVLAGMVAGMAVDFLLSTLYGVSGARAMLTDAAGLLRTIAGLLLPLFFFMAAVRYRLLERHGQNLEFRI